MIFGAGTLARLAYAYLVRDTAYTVVACTVHRRHLADAERIPVPSVAFEDLAGQYPADECSMFVAVGYTDVNRARAKIFDECRSLGYRLATVVSSRAQCWDDLRIGANCLVFDGVVIEPGVELGDDVIVWSGSQISHDTVVGDHCFLGPNAVLLGDVSVGERSFVGGNATVRNGVSVAADCVIGAGSVVKRNTLAGEVYSAVGTKPLPGTQSSELEDL